jgi:hypothetical protein
MASDPITRATRIARLTPSAAVALLIVAAVLAGAVLKLIEWF